MSDRKISQVAKELIAAKKRIENPENWICGNYIRKEKSCAVGAVALAQGRRLVRGEWERSDPAVAVLNNAAKQLFGVHKIYELNDTYSHADVMSCFDHAIATEIQKANAS